MSCCERKTARRGGFLGLREDGPVTGTCSSSRNAGKFWKVPTEGPSHVFLLYLFSAKSSVLCYDWLEVNAEEQITNRLAWLLIVPNRSVGGRGSRANPKSVGGVYKIRVGDVKLGPRPYLDT